MILNCLLYQLPPHQSRALIYGFFLSVTEGINWVSIKVRGLVVLPVKRYIESLAFGD